MDDERPDIEQNEVDLAVGAWAVTLGYMPAVGPIVAELFRNVIPNQRHDRIADFLRILDDKLSSLEEDFLREKMRTEEFVDLFEDGAYQAARALTDERKERIAALLKNSLTDEDLTQACEIKASHTGSRAILLRRQISHTPLQRHGEQDARRPPQGSHPSGFGRPDPAQRNRWCQAAEGQCPGRGNLPARFGRVRRFLGRGTW